MSSADSISSWIDILHEVTEIVVLDMVHSLTIKFLYALPNLTVIFVVIREFMFLTPMTKIRWEDKQSFGIIEVRSKDFTIILGHFLIYRTCENWNYFDLVAYCFVDERKVHLNTMFIFLVIDVNHEKSFLFFELFNHIYIYIERTKRSIVFVHIGERTPWKVLVMRRPKDENSLDVVRAGDILISPSRRRSTEVVSGMRSDQSLDLLWFFVLFRPIYVRS